MPLAIQYCSDLHLEFRKNKEFLTIHPLQAKAGILLLAGDIVPFAKMDAHKSFFDELSDKFETVYWVPGNHEYYHSDASKRSGSFNEKIRSNVFLVNNVTLLHHNVRFIFSTLWSKIRPENEWQVETGINDFRLITYNGSLLTSAKFNGLHQTSRNFIEAETAKPYAGKTIVVSHHVPTFLNYPVKYRNSIFNDAFVTELSDLIEKSHIDYWLYGHNHHNVTDFTIGNTQLITNQLGYVNHNEHHFFDNGKVISFLDSAAPTLKL